MPEPIILEHMLTSWKPKTLFLWQTQIQAIEYGLNGTIGMKKKEFILIINSFPPPRAPSDVVNFQTNVMPQLI